MSSVALKRVVRVVAGQSPPSGDVSALDDTGLAFLQGNAEFGMIHPRPKYRCDSASKRALAGDILLSVRAPVGALNIADRDYGIGRGLAAIRPGGIESRFAWWSLHAAIDELRSLATGSTFEAITADDIGSLRIRVPTLSRQREIADFLDAETGRIGALIEKKQQQVLALRERLTVEASAATRMRLLGAPLPDRDTSTGWKILRLRRCFSTMDYGIGEAVAQTGRYPVLGMGNVGEGRIVGEPIGYVSDVDPSLLLQPRDLLFNRTNSLALVGKVAIFEGEEARTTFASYLVRLRTSDLAEPEYLRYALNTPEFLGFARSNALPSVGQANLNPARYGSIFIPLPPRDEQQRVTADLDRRRRAVENVCSRLERQIELLREHRQALITAAVTGRLDVTKAAA